VVGGLLLNVTIQFIFCALVYSNFLETEFSQRDIDGFRAWRLRIAHDDQFSGATGLSLANRVCSLDPTLELATEHAARVDMILRYRRSLDTRPIEDDSFKMKMSRTFDGVVMCLLALTCWVLTVGKEMANAAQLLRGAVALPAAPGLCMHVVRSPGGTEIAGAGRVAKALAVSVCVSRLVVALVLLVMGCRYLAYTSSMQDLLLNAVALEVVMNVDELVFEALAPRRARQVLADLAPMRTASWPKLGAWQLRSACIGALLVVTVVWVRLTVLQEHIDNLKTAHTELCGGLQAFTVVKDRLGMVQFMHRGSFRGDSEFSDLTTVPDLAVQELIHGESFAVLNSDMTSTQNFMAGPGSNCRQGSCVPQYSIFPALYGFSDLALVAASDIRSLTGRIYSTRGGVACHDALDFTGAGLAFISKRFSWLAVFWDLYLAQTRTWLHYLNALSGRSTPGRSCADFRHLCGTKVGEAVTALCPITCGCNSLMRGGMTLSTSNGCPMLCMGALNAHEKLTATCADANQSNAGDSKWQELQLWADRMVPVQRQAVLARGCAGLLDSSITTPYCLAPTGFQVDSSPFMAANAPGDPNTWKLLTFLCPTTCNCGGRAGQLAQNAEPPAAVCPDSCTCRWPFSSKPPPGSSNCTVPYWSPTGSNNFSYAPVWTSSACCFLMREHSRTAQKYQNIVGSAEVRSTLCQPCYTACMEQLWSMPVVGAPGQWTYASEAFLLHTGKAEVTSSAAQVLCSAS